MTYQDEVRNAARAIDTGAPENRLEGPARVPRLEENLEENQHTSLEQVRDFVTDNPGPSLLFAAGLAWLFVNHERRNPRAIRSRVSEVGSSTKENLRDAGSSASSALSDARTSAAERAEQARLAARERAERAREAARRRRRKLQERYQETLQTNPLALGAAAIATGLAIGLMLPSTRRENELMGEVRDSMLDQARQIAREAQQAATRTLETAKDVAQEEIDHVAGELKEAASEVAEETRQAAETELDKAREKRQNSEIE